jgi:hypothetical protein
MKRLENFTPGIARQVINDIQIISASAYADAVLHTNNAYFDQSSPPGECFDELRKTFNGSEIDRALTEAFNNIILLVEARSITNPNPGQMEYLVREHLANIEKYRTKIECYVNSGQLPQDCLESFNAALAVATAKQPRASWIAAATQLNISLGRT